ncbi:bifunctional acetate--CoA ligase family protein/GNAT family N-acetyltransferase [Nitratireductor sp. ZSWI3]|uniref:bifunctional acetate--CoA ligase family protein/GNAT family N-acetyltransferase n=1 Tax=Nitratireductor sp. ZSWI3 TaxID=2966359 RepID=UPI00214F9A9E|nr:bifunctional acetate--CoA ligase family protein/GNAT family N-acetyltransferase [Nitratireductor sp. ZSWI3]MCR4266199.1 bifunctional acetate--CoA ligase family protein/GNAT family N-acetyltransferase [Nitratireductor sp. ZSWI3]
MTIRNLEFAARPTSVAVLGASNRPGAVGQIVMQNLLVGGFEGEIWPVNPKYTEVAGRRCYRRVRDIPAVPDLAVILTPPQAVPGLIGELGKKGTRAAVVITAGLTRENGLRQAMLDAAKPYLFRIIGPNTVGLMVPPMKFNASFAHMQPKSGGLALLSQSGAIATSLVDWAAAEGIGFSHIVSLGDMADVDVGDYLEMLAGDGRTRGILMYLETVPSPRKFMTAARAAARLKPVIAIKAGRHAEAAKAAATHTGALSGADRVVEAALRRAGILRVIDLGELFDAAEILARFAPLQRSQVGIVSNGGGAGVLAVDRLIDLNGALAEFTPHTLERLDRALPPNWSHANPADIIGDAPAERYSEAVLAVADDQNTDAVLVFNCPTGLASPSDAARAVAALADRGKVNGKPLITCWLGEEKAREGRRILQDAGIANFSTPSSATAALSYLGEWSRAQKALTRVPSSRSEDVRGDREALASILRQAAAEGRRMLTEPEAKAAIAAYGIPVPETVVVETPQAVGGAAGKLLETSARVVVKLLSKTISHKSDVGGVALDLKTPEAATAAAEAIVRRLQEAGSEAALEGFVVQPMVSRKHAHELILGVSQDPVFGPVVLFGAGGTSVEVVDDTAIALPPLDDVLAGDLLASTRIGKLLAGYRDRAPADREAIIGALNAMSQMIVDFPCIKGMDINPLIADSEGVVALDARLEIEPSQIDRKGPNPDIAIRPYPDGWEKDVDLEGHPYHLRPIKPADVALFPDFLARVSPEDIRFRFLAPRKHFPDEMLLRLTQLDYERDMAFIALRAEDGEMAGIGRLSSDPDKEVAEYGLLVRTDLQGHGLGFALLKQLIDYGKAEGIGAIEGIVLSDNTKMLNMCREFGFEVKEGGSEAGVITVSLAL